jgi:hypothetical protein
MLRILYTEKEINKEKSKYKKKRKWCNFLQAEPYGQKGAEQLGDAVRAEMESARYGRPSRHRPLPPHRHTKQSKILI